MNKSYYLKHQITAWHDPRIQAMIKQEGIKAYGVYWYIVEKLHLLPYQKAKLTYLKHFVEKRLSYKYMIKIVTEFNLFNMEGEYFSPVCLNDFPATDNSMKSDEKEVENDEKCTRNDVKSEKNKDFSTKKEQNTAKRRNIQPAKFTDKALSDNNLKKEQTSLSYYNIIITTTINKENKEKPTIAAEFYDKKKAILALLCSQKTGSFAVKCLLASAQPPPFPPLWQMQPVLSLPRAKLVLALSKKIICPGQSKNLLRASEQFALGSRKLCFRLQKRLFQASQRLLSG